jgi:nicotinate-nucleotide pyrophosphorylase (carboxylating)
MSMDDLNTLGLSDLFEQLVLGRHLDALLALAIEEDLGERGDVTTAAHPRAGVSTGAVIRSRESGVLSGVPVLDLLLRRHASRLSWWWGFEDGDRIESGDVICRLSGSLAWMLPVERTLLNMLGRLSGVATNTARFVDAASVHPVRICDTRKTTPGYRALEKYAVRCGGGWMHRIGLHDAFLLKDNHFGDRDPVESVRDVHEAVRRARAAHDLRFVEVEVDTLEQLRLVLTSSDHSPISTLIDIVLLDNMPPAQLREAVAWRDRHAEGVLLEASGGITLETIPAVASTGVDRIAVGALTHSSRQLDFGLDLT